MVLEKTLNNTRSTISFVTLARSECSLPHSFPPPQCRWRSQKPWRPRGWECILFFATLTAMLWYPPERHVHGLSVSASAQGEESHDPCWSTPIMNICWHLSIWEQMHFVLKYSHALIIAQACAQTPEAHASAANMQLCGDDVIDFLHWLEAATSSD